MFSFQEPHTTHFTDSNVDKLIVTLKLIAFGKNKAAIIYLLPTQTERNVSEKCRSKGKKKERKRLQKNIVLIWQ